MSNGLRDRFGFAPARARGRPSPAAGAEPGGDGGDGGRRDAVDAVGKITAALEVVENAGGINGR